jgi:valyl-tRNA synthetase
MINWDPAAQTALSDEEVIPRAQKGNLYYVRYQMVDDPDRFLEVATTRPETIMADTGVAVHPADPRYQDLIGREAWRPLAREKIPVIADDLIDREFGTGVLKVTPAHDKLDFEIGQRHNLPIIDVLRPDGRIDCPAVPELDGLDRFAAREKAGELLQAQGLLGKVEPHQNNVGFSERSEVPIEPRLSEQWFLRYPKTEEALAVVREHLIRFFPQHWEKVYAQWLENIQDWCISRQIWWGHRIPAWYRVKLEAGKRGAVAAAVSAAIPGKAADTEEIRVQLESPGDGWNQDPDTLDTWFSSWLWAYETMDDETRRKFYPTSVLVTGPDIIFFWVARMIIAGLEFRPGKTDKIEDNIAFRDVFFTGIIRDKQGRKMSKSLGNSPDPLDLIEKYGADGLRFALMRIAPSGQDIRFDEKQIEEGRNFATKLWNAARFRQMHGPSSAEPQIDQAALSIYAVEVLARLNETLGAIDTAFREYHFNAAAQHLYDFFWNDYCDWFVEAAKTDIFAEDPARKNPALAVMDFVLSVSLRLLHPFMPHITEELWALLGFGEGSIQFAREPVAIPTPAGTSTKRKLARDIYETVQAGRNLRAEARVPSNKKVPFILRSGGQNLGEELPTLARLLHAENVVLDPNYQPQSGMSVAVTPLGEIILATTVADKSAERERLEKEVARIETELKTVQAKLGNAFFVDRAPAAVVEEHRGREKKFGEQLAKLKEALKAL